MRTRIVIIGAGFGGVAAARRLSRADVDITIVDRRNYHLFQPLLYQVATADLSPADIAWPIRSMFARQQNVSVVLSEVTGVDTAARQVITNAGNFDYDFLVVACGGTNHYFGNDAWSAHAPGLKDITDATEMRRRILLSFEQAEICQDHDEQQRFLNFIIVGGGPTGVEMAGAIAELARVALVRDFRRIDPRHARVVLVEAGERLLAGFSPKLSDYARRSLLGLGVEVITNELVTSIDGAGVQVGHEFIPSATVIWAAGVRIAGPAEWLDISTDQSGRVTVNPDLSLPAHPEIYVVGDAAAIPWKDNAFVPGLAPAAKQSGHYAADAILARMRGSPSLPSFKYRHEGSLATIGRNAAVADLGYLKLTGSMGWWFWGLIHIYFLINGRAPT
ncbi:MAG: NAD(P)/FAD-dependent oxidoreductase, partial [Hyphomicrobiaceae bacterium]